MLPKADGKEHLPFGVTEGSNFYDWKDKDDFLSVQNAELSRYMADQAGYVSQYFVFLGVQRQLILFPRKGAGCQNEITQETAHVIVSAILFGKLDGMKTRSKLQGIGAATTKTNCRNKEPDQSYLPISLLKGRSRQ